MKCFRRTVVALTLAAGFLMSGCGPLYSQDRWAPNLRPHVHEQALAKDGCDHRYQLQSVSTQDQRGIVDDLDMIFMTDRPSRLNKWHDR